MRLPNIWVWKKWPRWFVIRGNTDADKEYVEMIKRSAARFGGKVVGEKAYDLPPGARNTDSGYQQVQAQIPMETEGAPDHDVIWVANSDEGFGDYLMYRTYNPDPIVGTQGLQALAWDPSYTELGAMHFQNGLPKLAKRKPVERDYTAWLGGRALTDGIMRSGKTTPPEVKAYLLSDQFKLEGFKGQAMSFRPWTISSDSRSSWAVAPASRSRFRRRKASCTPPMSPTRLASMRPRPSASSNERRQGKSMTSHLLGRHLRRSSSPPCRTVVGRYHLCFQREGQHRHCRR